MKVNLFAAIVILSATTVVAQKVKTVKSSQGDIVLYSSKCKLMLKQISGGFTFGGIDFVAKSPVTKIGTVGFEPKLLQPMSTQAQILDQFQFNSCQQLNSVPLSDPKRVPLIAVQGVSSFQLAQLALLAQMYSDNSEKLQDALLKWIVSSGEIMQQVWAKQFTAASSEQAKQRQSASEATAFAIDKLGIASDPNKMNVALRDQLRLAIQ